jgi:hypothetical protein
MAVFNESNVTVKTFLDVGNVYPEILNVTIEDFSDTFELNANSTANLTVKVVIRDYNGDADVYNLSMRFFDGSSSYSGTLDNNNHYRNSTCSIDRTWGDIYHSMGICNFTIEYYANNDTWNATAEVYDNESLSDRGSDDIIISELLALALPDSIDYGEVNATAVSAEKLANVTNVGNIRMNLSLSGYAREEGDGFAMNCTAGSNENISIMYEKYNLTDSNDSAVLTLSEFESLYVNLTENVIVRRFDLDHRTNDTDQFVGETNTTYWRIYVPIGPAGTCTGNIVFGANRAVEA